ncbi:hypothetical protein ACFWVB_20180 [Streptomyces microflavus]|uniref:hypothetical protein n=1 Tax=Streptomyces microflavus TaxID=1919 RepID=UPI003651AA3B
MKKSITLSTEPHEAEIGPYRLFFQPEMYGDEFLDAYSQLQEVQRALSGGDVESMSTDQLRMLYSQMRRFLSRLMTEESAAEFLRFVVRDADGTVLSVHTEREDAETEAARLEGAGVADESIRLPDRVLVELLEWVVEVYGGGNRPTGSSSGSAPASSRGGPAGKGRSPSRASTRAVGVSAP